ncbi:uncharacterized protein [Montipora capricornis]|uniref:uncharacterized protein isoform X2 n=1 Tax=Montipora capricornis TaxID=246305 RepID=UPI0035F151E6
MTCVLSAKSAVMEVESIFAWLIANKDAKRRNAYTSGQFLSYARSSLPRFVQDLRPPRVPVSQFTHWFPAVSHKVSQSGTRDSYQNFASSSEGNGDKALAFPLKLQESLASPSCDPQQIVSPFKEKQPRMEAAWIRCLSWVANIAKRLDVVQHLRSISPEGTIGPLLSENLDVREISFELGRQLTIALSADDNTYKAQEYFSYNEYSFYDLENVIDSSGRRQIQPDPKVKFTQILGQERLRRALLRLNCKKTRS